jgi:micrococcal nuclease
MLRTDPGRCGRTFGGHRADLCPSRARIVPALAAALAFGACSAPEPAPSDQPVVADAAAVRTCVVARVVDGDTLTCDDGARVRLLSIDAPELSQHPFGRAALRQLEELAAVGTVLRVEQDVQRRDRYGRILAYLWLEDGRMVNEELLLAGVAIVAVHPPNVRHVERLRAAVEKARARKAGLWAADAFDCAPADHRAGRC